MAMDQVSVERLTLVYPYLCSKINTLYESLSQEAINIHVTQGLRTWAQQDALYAQGRTTPGPIVTRAPGGYSWHNFGLAVDVAPFDLLGHPDWNLTHPAWGRIVAVGESLGLTSGISFHDEPHLQISGPWPMAAPPDVVRQLFKDQGLTAIWSQVNSYLHVAA